MPSSNSTKKTFVVAAILVSTVVNYAESFVPITLGVAPGVQHALVTPSRTFGSTSSPPSYRLGTGASLSARLHMTATAGVDEAVERAEKLKAAAAALRAEAEVLQSSMVSQQKQKAALSFKRFDSNGDGVVDFDELKNGLEKVLLRDFKAKLARKYMRPPTQEEVDAHIGDMPNGTLVPDYALTQLLQMYDRNSDGVLSVDEFRRTEEMRASFERIFRLQEEEERMKRLALRESKLAEVKEQTDGAAGNRNAMPSLQGLEAIEVNNGPPTVSDRLLGMIPFLMPLMDSTIFGAHLFNAFPEQFVWAQPLVALMLLYRAIPFGGIAAFFAMSAAANNPKVNKLQRFNMRQAINLDIALFIPSVLFTLSNLALTFASNSELGIDLLSGSNGEMLASLMQNGSDAVFIGTVLACVYSMVSTAFGVTPDQLPVLTKFNREFQFQESIRKMKEEFEKNGGGAGSNDGVLPTSLFAKIMNGEGEKAKEKQTTGAEGTDEQQKDHELEN